MPLSITGNEIRVLRILPRHSSNGPGRKLKRIECLLEHESLDDKPVYNTLSYTWQSNDSDIHRTKSTDRRDGQLEIVVDGRRLKITEKLWSILVYLRDRSKVIKWNIKSSSLAEELSFTQ